jgi:hypothetical protein
MRTSGKATVIIAVFVLLFAIGLQWVRLRNMEAGNRNRSASPIKLSTRLPAKLSGWEVVTAGVNTAR